MSVEVTRNTCHPWTGEAGWDRMVLVASCAEELHALVAAGQRKHWRIFHSDAKTLRALMFKPTGTTEIWREGKWQGCNDQHSKSLQVGDIVYTDFSGRVTQHKVLDRRDGQICQTGVGLKVNPPVPGSRMTHDDPGRGLATNTPWMSAAWFRKVQQ